MSSPRVGVVEFGIGERHFLLFTALGVSIALLIGSCYLIAGSVGRNRSLFIHDCAETHRSRNQCEAMWTHSEIGKPKTSDAPVRTPGSAPPSHRNL
jgi:hypothetical protein